MIWFLPNLCLRFIQFLLPHKLSFSNTQTSAALGPFALVTCARSVSCLAFKCSLSFHQICGIKATTLERSSLTNLSKEAPFQLYSIVLLGYFKICSCPLYYILNYHLFPQVLIYTGTHTHTRTHTHTHSYIHSYTTSRKTDSCSLLNLQHLEQRLEHGNVSAPELTGHCPHFPNE